MALAGAPGAAQAAELLPSLTARLEAARYVPAETEMGWTAWIGAGATLIEAGSTALECSADVESIVGDERRSFDATQANYHLEVALMRRSGGLALGPFFHHVSRHAIDRPKPEAVDWNVLGLRASLRTGSVRPVRIALAAGRATLASLVGYRWELTGSADAELLGRESGRGYLRADLRAVTVRRSAEFPRGSFADLRLEGGGRWRKGDRALETFAAFERRNDVLLVTPAARSRLLLGFRLRVGPPLETSQKF